MCGIAGFFGRSEEADARLLARFGDALAHRGPDGHGVFLEDGCGLAFRRLSLLDLSPQGDQPFQIGRHALIYNGEIYNFRELRRELENAGVAFRSTSDTEVLLRLLVSRGLEATLAALRGMFAFAWYDGAARRLVLARDRVGIKPLFWWWRGRTLFFASELKALLEAGQPELDTTALFFAGLGVLEKARTGTAFREVRQLEPGSWLSLEAGDPAPRLGRYFTPADLIDERLYRELENQPSKALVHRLGLELGAAVDRMRVADAPMGAFVSGGVDSSLLAALARGPAGERGQDLELLTADVRGPLSEVEDARALAAHLGRPLHEAPFAPADFAAGWAEATWAYGSPLVVHANAVPFLGVARLARRRGLKAVLTGEGADELFMGYPALASSRYDAVVHLPYRLLDALYSFLPGLSRRRAGGETLLGELEKMAQGFERQTLRAEGWERLDFLPPAKRQWQYVSLQMMSEGLLSLLWRNDRMGMAASIEARFPYLDEEVLRFAVNVPAAAKIGRTWRLHQLKHPFLLDKALLRRLAARHLPRALAFKPKNGFPVFGLRDLEVDDTLFARGFWQRLLGWRDAQVASWLASTRGYDRARFAGVEIWGRLYGDRQEPGEVAELVRRTVRPRRGLA